MADIKWIKLSVNMFDDEKIKLIRTMPEGDKISLIWIQMLCLAGRINDGGLVYMGQNLAYSDEMLGTILGHPLNVMRAALKTLEQFGMIEVSDDGKIDILNWGKHQSIEGMERIKDGNAERQRVRYYRKKLKEIGVDAYSEGMPSSSEALKSMFDDLKDKKPHVRLTLAHGPELELEEELEEELELEEDKEIVSSSSSASENNVSDVFTFYQNNFGVMSPYHQDDLTHWSNDLSPDLAIEAMKRAIDGGKQFNYAKGILKNWMQKNFKTIADIEASEAQFERNKQQAPKQHFPYKRNQKADIIPDWMKQQEQELPKTEETSNEQTESKEAEIRARLEALGLGDNDD